jgi:hypothetical protein
MIRFRGVAVRGDIIHYDTRFVFQRDRRRPLTLPAVWGEVPFSRVQYA